MGEGAKNDISYGGIAAGIGGFIGLLGVSIGWWEYTATGAGSAVTERISGMEDWTGAAGVAASIAVLAFGVAFVLLSDKGIRRFCTFVMALGGIALVGVAMMATGRADDAVGTPGIVLNLGPDAQIARSVALGLWTSTVGGLFSLMGALLMYRQASDN